MNEDDFTVRNLVAILRYVMDGRGFSNYGVQIESLDFAATQPTDGSTELLARVRRDVIHEFEITIRRKR